jgi:L-asparaginase/Glu-tRNA(Gln) amidotransferase subunit D
MPHSEELLELLKSTQEKREIVVIMIPQCIKIVTEKAGLKESYKEGLIVRYDITPEAALAKMGYLKSSTPLILARQELHVNADPRVVLEEPARRG